jgi:hypothetical protein
MKGLYGAARKMNLFFGFGSFDDDDLDPRAAVIQALDEASSRMGRVAFQLFLKYPRAELPSLDGVAEEMKGLGAASRLYRVVVQLLLMCSFRVVPRPHWFVKHPGAQLTALDGAANLFFGVGSFDDVDLEPREEVIWALDGAASRMGRVVFQLLLEYPRVETPVLDGVAERIKGLDGAASSVDRVVVQLLLMCSFRVIPSPCWFVEYPRAELTALNGTANKVDCVVVKFLLHWSRAEGMKGLDGSASKVDIVVVRLLSMSLFCVIPRPHLLAIFRLETCGGVEDSAAIDNRWVGLLATLTDWLSGNS